MTTRVSVVGANGRVGSALVRHLAGSHDVVAIQRRPDESPDVLATRAADGVDVLINAAGVAHIEHPTPADLERLRVGNVELPMALAAAALEHGVSMIHISSVKATADADSEYGKSKYEADRRMHSEFGGRFDEAGLGLVIVRPMALLIPPFEAGKIARLNIIRWWPEWATPAVRLPVLTPGTFLAAVDGIIDTIHTIDKRRGRGVRRRDFDRSERGTLRDVRRAISAGRRRGGGLS